MYDVTVIKSYRIGASLNTFNATKSNILGFVARRYTPCRKSRALFSIAQLKLAPRRTASVYLLTRRVRSPIPGTTNKIALPPFYMKIVADDEFNDCATALARASAASRVHPLGFIQRPDAFRAVHSGSEVALIVAYRDIWSIIPSLSHFSRRIQNPNTRRHYYLRTDRDRGMEKDR